MHAYVITVRVCTVRPATPVPHLPEEAVMRPSTYVLIFLLLVLWQRLPWLPVAASNGVGWLFGQTALLAVLAGGIVIHRIHRSVT